MESEELSDAERDELLQSMNTKITIMFWIVIVVGGLFLVGMLLSMAQFIMFFQ